MCGLLLAIGAVSAQPKVSTKKPARHGDWFAKVLVDKMTDAKECVVLNAKDPFVRFDPVGRLDVNFKGRGGVAVFRYRIDSLPASGGEVVADSRNDHLSVSDIRDEFNTARRLLIQGETLLGKPINLEYDMRGLAEARGDAAKLCEE